MFDDVLKFRGYLSITAEYVCGCVHESNLNFFFQTTVRTQKVAYTPFNALENILIAIVSNKFYHISNPKLVEIF